MKLHELKEATVKLKLPDTKHVAEMGKVAFRMGILLTSNPHHTALLNETWAKGWNNASREWESFLKKNGADSRNKIWGSL